jgi:phage shock protein A
MADIKELTKLKEQIEEAKTKKAEAQGELNSLMARLKDEFGCKTLKSGEDLLDKMEEEINGLEETIEDGIVELLKNKELHGLL